MHKLDRLIEKKSFTNVEFKYLGDICNIKTGKGLTKSDTKEDGRYPIISGGVLPLGYYETFNRNAGNVTIARAGNAGYVNFIETPFWCNDKCFSIIPIQDKYINKKFMYYYLKNIEKDIMALKSTGTVPTVNTEKVSKIKIAVPPLEVQDEIVHILDDFTLLSAELSAELKARQKQYEYYFNKIMNNEKYDKMKIGDIGQVKMCRRILKSQTNNIKGIPFYKIGTFGKEPDAFIDEETFNEYKEKYSYPKKGDILISCSGTIGRTVIFDGEPAYFQDSNIVWLEHDNTKVINEYLFYCYKTNPWSISTGGTIARLYNDNILKAEISVPPIEEQKRIVEKLNRFYKICNDISEGLPAEIEARRKQYEYYRDKLLTFEEKKDE